MGPPVQSAEPLVVQLTSSPPQPKENPENPDEKHHPHEVAAPPPGVVIKRGGTSGSGRALRAASLDVPRIWRSPSAVAPTIADRRQEKDEQEDHPQPEPGAHHFASPSP